MWILGIDPSYTSTGWCLIECDGNKIVSINCGSIPSEPTASTLSRLCDIVYGLHKITNGEDIDYVFLESEAMQGTGQVVQLAELTGAIKYHFSSLGCRILTYTPLQARKLALGHSKIPFDKDKQLKEYIEFIRDNIHPSGKNPYHFGYLDSDRYDAYVIASAAMKELNSSTILDENLMLMRLRDEKIVVKNRKGLYTIGSGKKRVQFRNLKKVDKEMVKDLFERYREILGFSNN